MRLPDGETKLLLAVIPAFVAALPPEPTSISSAVQGLGESGDKLRAEDSLRLTNSILILRFEIQQLSRTFTDEYAGCDFSDKKAFGEAEDALEEVLVFLEGLVDDLILLDDASFHFGVELSHFPKLNRLRWQLDTATFPTSGESQKYIRYGWSKAVHYRRAAKEAQRFNVTMRRIFESQIADTEPRMRHFFQAARQPRNEPDDYDRERLELLRAKTLHDSIKYIARLVTSTDEPCQPTHSGLVHLTGFHVHEPEIDMIMSVCGTGEDSATKWHYVHWFGTTETSQSSQRRFSICSQLRSSRRLKTHLRIQVGRDGCRIRDSNLPACRTKAYVAVPSCTLSELLHPNTETPTTMGDSMQVLKRDRLNLATDIARSLMFLLDTPFLQDPWRSEGISISKAADHCRVPAQLKPYISVRLSKEALDAEFPLSHAKSFILDLGVLLWDLFFGRSIVITDEDRESDYAEEEDQYLSLYNALNREECDSRQWCVDVPSLDIIANCLNLYGKLDDVDLVSLQKELYWNVVQPLDCLGSYGRPVKHRPAATTGAARPRVPDITFRAPSTVAASASASDFLVSSRNLDNSTSWLDKFYLISRAIDALPGSATAKPVRLAILDTGCNLDDPFFNGPGIGTEDRLASCWLDCLGESEDPVDQDPGQHGTALTALLLRILPPSVGLYIIRVAKDAMGLSNAKQDIAMAILYAVQKWDVDIISMSFGFESRVSVIEDALQQASKLKDGKILFFAAANNDGANAHEMFPALDDAVISVRGTRYDGSFVQKFDPPVWPNKAGMKLFGTLGHEVPCGWTAGRLTKSGCSVATPIMAAIAATIISFTEREKDRFEVDDVMGAVRTRWAMLAIFGLMGEDKKSERFYLAPWHFFQGQEHVARSKSLIEYAVSKLPRRESSGSG